MGFVRCRFVRGWRVCISSCSYGISIEDLWIGLSSVIESLRGSYSCLFCNM
jgi:hypothetical protein